ncbi:hypothetical protein [Streptomyces sp. NPDC006551]|uniref:hypothetical protein n=1 Tax=Streptomyces sp. NPDC006551 TaxID=3157178 RepID=UPI0033A5B552
MASNNNSSQGFVALNEIAELIHLLKYGGLAELLGEPGVGTDCDVRCECKTTRCACAGSVQALTFADTNPEAGEELKARRVDELRRQLAEAESEMDAEESDGEWEASAEPQDGPGSRK